MFCYYSELNFVRSFCESKSSRRPDTVPVSNVLEFGDPFQSYIRI